MSLNFGRCELYLYIISLETSMYLHDWGDLDSADAVQHYDNKIVSIYTDENAARRALAHMKLEDFFNDTQIQYDINFATLILQRYVVVGNNEAEDDEYLTSRSLI